MPIWLFVFVLKIPSLNDDFNFLFQREIEVYSFARSILLLCNMTTCTPTKSNLHFANSLSTVYSDADMQQPPMSIFRSSGRSTRNAQVPGLVFFYLCLFLRWGLVNSSPSFQARWPPIISCLLLLSIFSATLTICWLSPSSATWWRSRPFCWEAHVAWYKKRSGIRDVQRTFM
jgi:hypothetical protein